MNISEPFIRRPVGTALLTAAIALAGIVAYLQLPVAPLPQVDFPSITVQAALPGASPEIMASSVAAPLERQLGHIAGVNEMTSASYLGTTTITLQFDLSRDINGAARDVQAAINAARANLPANLPNNPAYRKVNPADAPIMILALTSDIYDRGAMYDAASTIIQQRLLQIQGVGQVNVGGGALPAVRVDVNPTQLNSFGLGLEDVRLMLSRQNANLPKGQLSDDKTTADILANDQLLKAEDYKPLIVAYRHGAAIRLSDIANVQDSVENVRAAGFLNGKPSIPLIVFRQPGANIIETVDRIKAAIPSLKASIPSAINFIVVLDRTTTIRASVFEVERTLVIAIGLVILVIYLFLRSLRATIIPGVAVPLSLIGTFGVMYLCGYSLNNLSLMALTISTGFVVDDAIVMIENISRFIEEGDKPFEAALKGSKQIGFTIVSLTVSLVAVLIPLLFMGGLIGRLFREFAVTLAIAIGVSAVLSLTLTAMMCAHLLKPHSEEKQSRLERASEHAFEWMIAKYGVGVDWVLRHQFLTLVVTIATVVLTAFLALVIPKGFFPLQDTGLIVGVTEAGPDVSFSRMMGLQQQVAEVTLQDPDVANVASFIGADGTNATSNSGRLSITLKPRKERNASAQEIIDRLRGNFQHVEGIQAFLQPVQDLQVESRQSRTQFQYTLEDADPDELAQWAPKMAEKMRSLPELRDVASDLQTQGLQLKLNIDRDTAARMGVLPQAVDDALYDAFGQRQVSTIFTQLNQYRVILELKPEYQQDPGTLDKLYVRTLGGDQVPLSSIASGKIESTALAVNHQGQFPAVTLSFDTAQGVALGQAVDAIRTAETQIGLPPSVRPEFAGSAQAFGESLQSEPILIVAALLTVYIVLGVLYESYIHPVTILSTLPSAGVGALLALMICRIEFSVIALIGIILLIGIVKKNAIMMIDFALEAERDQGMTPQEAIRQACLLRFRPIMMTTMAALLGGIPLALGQGTGSELRRPLGISIVGGLLVSQVLTLYTTPVVYLYMERLSRALRRRPKTAEVVPSP